jgi:GTPase KRas protein
MLVGNKSDRVTEREVSTQEGHALARELGCEFVEASAKNCINVEKAFYDVVRILRRQRQSSSPHARPPRGSDRTTTRDKEDRRNGKGRGNHGNSKGGKGIKCVLL